MAKSKKEVRKPKLASPKEARELLGKKPPLTKKQLGARGLI